MSFFNDDDSVVHKHRCQECGFVWSHSADQIKSDRQNDKAHLCPACGQSESYMWYEGPKDALCVWAGKGRRPKACLTFTPEPPPPDDPMMYVIPF